MPSPSLAVSLISTDWQTVAILGSGLQETNTEKSVRSHSGKKDGCREVPTPSKNCLKMCHHFIYFLKMFIYLAALCPSCGVWDPLVEAVSRPGVESGPLHREHQVLATGCPGKSQSTLFYDRRFSHFCMQWKTSVV